MSVFWTIRNRMLLLSCLLGIAFTAGNLVAQQAPKNDSPKNDSKPGASSRTSPRKGPGFPHAGTWLRRYQAVPPAEQEKALNNDPEFQKLPADSQNKLRERLHQFNSYSPEKRQRILKRMEVFEHLSPAQQEQARELFGRLRTLPDDRRKVVRRTARNLRQFDAAERERLLETDEYRNSFNDDERALIKELSALDLDAAAAEHRAESPKNQ